MLRSSTLAIFAFALAACGDSPEPVVDNAPIQEQATSPAYTTEEVFIAGPSGRLGGIKTLPASPATDAVAIIIPGSGPTDRDGNNPGGLSTDAYRLLAEALAERGIASTRIDKRGMFSSAEGGDPNDVTLTRYADDVVAWAEVMDTDCVMLLGHSEGGLVALEAASRGDACGVVLLTVPGRRLGDVIREQLSANPANIIIQREATDILERLERGKRVPDEEIGTMLKPLFREDVQGFMIDSLAFDAPTKASALGVPLMVVGGGEDIQVTRDDYDLFAQHADTALWVEGMSHTLKTTDGSGRRASLATYSDPGLPLSDGLADQVADFIKTDR